MENSNLFLPIDVGRLVLPTEVKESLNETTYIPNIGTFAFIKKELVERYLESIPLYQVKRTKEQSVFPLKVWPFYKGPVPMIGPIMWDGVVSKLSREKEIVPLEEYGCMLVYNRHAGELLMKRNFSIIFWWSFKRMAFGPFFYWK